MAFCSSCGTQVADGTTLCPACSSRAPVSPAAAGGGLTDNVAGMLAYVTIIPAIIFLVIGPLQPQPVRSLPRISKHVLCCRLDGVMDRTHYRGNDARFRMGSSSSGRCSVSGGLIVWIILLLKANQGQMFKLPIIGDMAEKQAKTAV